MQIEFAKQNCSRGFQSLDDECIFSRNALLEEMTRGRSADAGRIDKIFERQRNSVQWTTILASTNLSFSLSRFFEGALGSDGDKRVQRRIQPFDSRQATLCQGDRGDLSGANLL